MGKYVAERGEKRKVCELYLVLYAVFRFALEFARYDDSERGILMGLSTSQWISIVICSVVIGMEILTCRKKITQKSFEKCEK